VLPDGCAAQITEPEPGLEREILAHTSCCRREIGIRLAIGSTRVGIVRIVTFDAYLTISLGGCAGVTLGISIARYVEALFYRVKATDADMIALPACAMLLTTLVATLPAVLRALRTDPAEILRAE
jgi:ABC-type antimicrobial peptide transport system permease subunit